MLHVTCFITKHLCKNQGCLEFKEIYQIVHQLYGTSGEELFDILNDSGKFVITGDESEKVAGFVKDLDARVTAKTLLRVCPSLAGDCETCDDLHLCRYFVCGECRRKKCKYSHNLDSDHNKLVLEKDGLRGLDKTELFQLLLQNDTNLLPDVCSYYNIGRGDYGSCKRKENCTKLHVCKYFLQEDCMFGDKCRRAHRFDLHSKNILGGRGVSLSNEHLLPKIYRNRFMIAGPQAPRHNLGESSDSEKDGKEICRFFIRGQCYFKGRCTNVHCPLPYKWQVLDCGGIAWRDLPDMEEVEMAYCDPKNDISDGPEPVNFLTMMCGSARVRRLSTASSVSVPPQDILTTEWLWYYKGEQGRWTECGSEADGKLVSSIISQSLEKTYLEGTENDVLFTAEGRRYILNFKEMYQLNVQNETKAEVRRRPAFISPQEVEKQKRCPQTNQTVKSVLVEKLLLPTPL